VAAVQPGHDASYAGEGDDETELGLEKPDAPHLGKIGFLDHTATRVRAADRDSAIIEFMRLTNFKFDFAIYVRKLNSITNVARLREGEFAMVFTSGIKPYVEGEEPGPTEAYIRNYGTRTHHLAFATEDIDDTFGALKAGGMKFLSKLLGSPDEGLKQAFSAHSPTTLLVNEYIHRYGGFDGFFTKSNVTELTRATGKQ
jgi:4-hydroxyphenylpyruvate dioxygenase-like putative hemolysin